MPVSAVSLLQRRGRVDDHRQGTIWSRRNANTKLFRTGKVRQAVCTKQLLQRVNATRSEHFFDIVDPSVVFWTATAALTARRTAGLSIVCRCLNEQRMRRSLIRRTRTAEEAGVLIGAAHHHVV